MSTETPHPDQPLPYDPEATRFSRYQFPLGEKNPQITYDEQMLWQKAKEGVKGNALLEEVINTLEGYGMMDEKTGLLNRKGFMFMTEHLTQESDLVLFHADMNYLKTINDTKELGHSHGDAALAIVGEFLQLSGIRGFVPNLAVGRVGGDEIYGVTRPNGINATLPYEKREHTPEDFQGFTNRMSEGLRQFLGTYDGSQKPMLDDIRNAGVDITLSIAAVMLPKGSNRGKILKMMEEADDLVKTQKVARHLSMTPATAQVVKEIQKTLDTLGIPVRDLGRAILAANVILDLDSVQPPKNDDNYEI